MIPIIDFHCDLLAYLAGKSSRTAMNNESHCSLPQLEKGGVKLQVCAIYSQTKEKSCETVYNQILIFQKLPELYPNRFIYADSGIDLQKKGVQILYSIENGSGLCGEREPLDLFFERMEDTIKKIGIPVYLSLTWNTENRFGGGNESIVGLKEDGKEVLSYLAEKKIAIDLSHTSDQLAFDILNFIEKKKLDICPVASHSNFRSVTNVKRNLSDEIAKEIAARDGVIGLNFVRVFVGALQTSEFIRQIEHAKKIGVFDRFCLGADFFFSDDMPPTLNHLVPYYFSKYSDASCYQDFFAFLKESFTKQEIEKIAYQNAKEFFLRRKQCYL